jgi:hypothetical protein
MLIISLIGIRRRAESHIGFIGVCMATVWFLLAILSMFWRMNNAVDTHILDWCGAVIPQWLEVSTGNRTVVKDWGNPWDSRFPVTLVAAADGY